MATRCCFFASCLALAGFSAADTIAGDLAVTGKTFEHNGWIEHTYKVLSGSAPNPATDSLRYEVARISVNTHHWQATGPIEIELRQRYFGSDGYLKFIVSAGYQNFSGSVALVEKRGSYLSADVNLGAPVSTGTMSSGYANQYIPIYIDLGYYTQWDVKIAHGWTLTTENVPSTHARFKFFENPVPTVRPNHHPAPTGADRLSSVQIFSGSVGIGTIYPSAPLHVEGDARINGRADVNGTIRAKEVIVESGWADHVFADGYALLPLAEVEAHIAANRRLPGVPSAEEVAASGVSIGESQRILLEKVEELTLYAIELQKQGVAKDAKISLLEQRLARLEGALGPALSNDL